MNKIFLYKKQGKEIVQTEVYAMVDEEDYQELSKHNWYIMKLYHCDTEILYARRYEGSPRKGNHKAILMHRFILGANDKSQKVDHKDGNGLNNTRDNIRIGTHSENMSNRKVSYKKDIKYLGVCNDRSNGKYKAILKKDGKVYTRYGFSSPELAAIGYNELIAKYNPIYGRFNIINKNIAV